MKSIKTGAALALEAMEEKLKILSAAAQKAKTEVQEYMDLGGELIAIHNDFVDVVKSTESAAEQLKKLETIKKRSARAEKIRNKDLLKLLDKEFETETAMQRLRGEIHNLKFIQGLRER